MEITKIYSETETGERLYSVLMSEEELRIFARADYAGLSAEEAQKLREARSKIAQDLNKSRKLHQAHFAPLSSDSPGEVKQLKVKKALADINSRQQAQNAAADARKAIIDARPKEPGKISKLKEIATPKGGLNNGFLGKNKTALGIGAGVAAIGTGAYLLNKEKNK